MEEMSLNQLTEEFKNLQQSVRETSSSLESMKGILDLRASSVVEARDAVEDAERTYNGIKTALESMERNPEFYNDAVIQAQRNNLAEAERTLTESRDRLSTALSDEKVAREAFDEVQARSIEQNDRIELILTSFGFNEMMNERISVELKFAYEDKIQEAVDARANIEAGIDNISQDEEVRNLLANVQANAQEYSRFLAENALSTDADINSRESELRTTYRRSVDELKVKMQSTYGVAMSDQDILNMGNLDPRGRLTINPLNNILQQIDTRRGTLEREKENALRKMELAKQAAKDPTVYDAEIASLQAELDGLTQNITDKETERRTLQAREFEIPEEKRRLTEDLNNIENGVDNTAAIAAKRNEIAGIDAELLNSVIDNPTRADLEKQIADLEEQIKNGGKVERKEYTDAVQQLEAAKKALADYLASGVRPDADKDKRIAEIDEEIAQITDEVKNDPVVENARKELEEATKRYEEAEKNLNENKDRNAAIDELRKTGYVSTTTIPELADKDSEEAKLFRQYRDAELNLRKAMLAVQGNPTKENMEAFQKAIKNYQTISTQFAGKLSKDDSQVTVEDCHNYLLEELERNDISKLDPAYRSSLMPYRLELLEFQYPKIKKSEIYKLSVKPFHEEIEDLFRTVTSGKEDMNWIDADGVEQTQPVEAYASEIMGDYAESLKGLEEEKGITNITEILTGKALPDVKRVKGIRGFFADLFGRVLPEEEKAVNFAYSYTDEQMDAMDRLAAEDEKISGAQGKNPKQILKGLSMQLYGARSRYESAIENKLSKDKQERLRIIKREKENLEKGIAVSEDKTKLEQAVQDAQSKVDGTEQYESVDTSELEKQKHELEEKRDAEPEKVQDTARITELNNKKASLEAEITVLEAGGRDEEGIRRIKERLAGLDSEAAELPSKISQVENEIASLTKKKTEVEGKFNILKKAKDRITNFIGKIIGIKDAERALYGKIEIDPEVTNAILNENNVEQHDDDER